MRGARGARAAKASRSLPAPRSRRPPRQVRCRRRPARDWRAGSRDASSRPRPRLARAPRRPARNREAGERADAHRVVRGERGQDVGGIDIREHRHRDRMRGVQVHDGAVAGPLPVHREVQQRLLGRRIAVDVLAVGGEQRQPRRIERAERAAGGCHQVPVGGPQREVPGAPVREPTLEQRAAERAQCLAVLRLVHRAAPITAAWRATS